MASKITFSIFMALLVFTAEAHKLKSPVDKILEALKIAVDAATEEAQHDIDVAKETFIKLANSTISSSESAMNKTVEDFKDDLAVIKQDAADANITIDDCLGDNESKLNNITIEFNLDVNVCVNTSVETGVAYVQKSLDDIKNLVSEVSEIQDDADACGKEWISVKCYTELTAKILAETVSLPVKILANSAAAVTELTQLGLQISSCKTTTTAKWNKEGKALLAAIKTCVDEKSSN